MGERRSTYAVPIAAVRPPLWSIATREVWDLEIERRSALQQEQPSHLPLVAELLEKLRLTPEIAEDKAQAHADQAEILCKSMRDAGAPPHVLNRFAEHRRFMNLQTKSAAFREGKALPIFLLVDGAHRWHAAVESGQEALYITAPVEATRVLREWNDASEKQKPLQKQSITLTTERSFVFTAALGAQYNYLSHVSSPVTLADRVFLIQSWLLGVLQSCKDLSIRIALEQEMSPTNVLRLLLHSVVKHRDGNISLTARQSKLAMEGEVLLVKLESFTSHLQFRGVGKSSILMPPALAVIHLPSASTPSETLARDVSDLVLCAVESACSPSARILIGHILRRRCREHTAEDNDPEAEVAVLEPDTKFSVSCFQCIRTAMVLARTKEDDSGVTQGCESVVGRVDIALMFLSSVMNIHVEDVRSRDALGVSSARRLRRITKTQLPPKTEIVKAIIEVCFAALRRGVPLHEVCKGVSHMKLVVGAAQYVLGQTVGRKIDRQELSFVLRASNGEVYPDEITDLGTTVSNAVCNGGTAQLIKSHSVNCFLAHVKADADRDWKSPAPLGSSNLLLSIDQKDSCCCDFFTDIARREVKGVLLVFFLSRSPISTLFGTGPDGKEPPKHVGLSELRNITSNFFNEQGENVLSAANRVRGDLQKLEADITSHRESGTDETSSAVAGRRYAILSSVHSMLDSLAHLSLQAGVAHSHETEGQFCAATSLLRELEAVWCGSRDMPSLSSAIQRYRPDDIDNNYKTVVENLSKKFLPNALPTTRTAVHDNFDLWRLWRTRAAIHMRGLHAVSEAEKKLMQKRKKGRRDQAQERKRTALTMGDEFQRKERTSIKRKLRTRQSSTQRGTTSASAVPSPQRRRHMPKTVSNIADEAEPSARHGPPDNAASKHPQGLHFLTPPLEEDRPTRDEFCVAPGETADKSGGIRNEAKKFDEASRDLVFYDTNDHPVPKRIRHQALVHEEAVQKLLPKTLSSGCNTRFFVSPCELENIIDDANMRSLYPKTIEDHAHADMVHERLIHYCLHELDSDGVAVIPNAFSGGQAQTDIDAIIRSACDRLHLVHGTPEDGMDIDIENNFVPIPNLGGGGRSMADRSFMAGIEQCESEADEKIARASHRHLVRVGLIVEGLAAADVTAANWCPPWQQIRKRSARVEHKCANTGGRVLITHPPPMSEVGRLSNSNLPQGALPQRPHIDFRKPYRAEEPRLGALPGRFWETPVFVICTGESGTALRLYPSSHRWSTSNKAVHTVGVQASSVKVIHVPPYSFLVMRGDCYHAGAGWLESKWANDVRGVKIPGNENFMSGIARWHAYFRTSTSSITNAVHYAQADEDTTFPDAAQMFFPDANGKRHVRTNEDFSFEMENIVN